MEMDNKTIAKIVGGLAALVMFSRVSSIASDSSSAVAEARKANDGITALRLELALDGITSSPPAAAKEGAAEEDAHGSTAATDSHGSTASGATSKSTESSHWTYSGASGPAAWGKLDASFAACIEGSAQSPIDLAQPKTADLPDLELAYKAVPAAVIDNGHTIQIDVQPGSKLTLGGATYELVQFHFHGPAEHTLAGRSYPAELHLVHKSGAGKLAVVGVLITSGDENPAFASVLANLPTAQNVGKNLPAPLDPSSLLPALRSTYRYAGSLTTPPCTEGVSWNVMAQPISMSKAQIDKLTAAFHEPNNRPVQKLGERELLLDTTATLS